MLEASLMHSKSFDKEEHNNWVSVNPHSIEEKTPLMTAFEANFKLFKALICLLL